MSKLIFCANCQKETEHIMTLSPSGESIFTCQTKDCGRFLKFPVGFTEIKLDDYVKKHEKVNKGQISLEKVMEKLGLTKKPKAKK